MERGRLIICSSCGHERRNSHQGQCKTCRGKDLRSHKRGLCRQCDREMPIIVGGLCGKCRSDNYKAKKGAELREKNAARERERRRIMGDEYRRRDRERNIQRREQRKLYNQAYYQHNKEQAKDYHRQWRKLNPGLRDLRKRRYKARKAGLQATLTQSQWEAIKDGFNHCCVYCNRRMQNLVQEHIIPVVQSGNYTADNILPACQSCNSRKHTSTGFEFLIRLATEKQTGLRIPGPSRRR